MLGLFGHVSLCKPLAHRAQGPPSAGEHLTAELIFPNLWWVVEEEMQ